MDIREHSVTLVSVVIGLGLTELLGNLNRLIRARGTVRWHGLPVAWTLYVLPLVWVRSERYHWCAAILVLALTAYRMTLQVLR